MSRINVSEFVLKEIVSGRRPVAKGLRITVESINYFKEVHFKLEAVDANGEVLCDIGTIDSGRPVAEGNSLTIVPLDQMFVVNIGKGTLS